MTKLSNADLNKAPPMSTLRYLTKEDFMRRTKELETGHWTPRLLEGRWDYHSRVVELIKGLGINDPSQVLEMGTMGITCVADSHTMDILDENWKFRDKKPTVAHDARQLPWPVANKRYDLFVALRVFQHLTPVQKECVHEAMRVASKIILVVPSTYDNAAHPAAKGITYQDLVRFIGAHPNLYTSTHFGDLYYFDLANPSRLDLEIVMAPLPAQVVYKTPPPGLLQRIEAKVRSLIKV